MKENMKFLSLAWFKSKIEQSVENVISSKIDKLIDQINEEEGGTPPSLSVYKTVKLVNDNLTVVLNNGEILNKPNATAEDFAKVKVAKNQTELFQIAASVEDLEEKRKQQEEFEKAKHIASGIKLLTDSGEFEVINQSVYMKGVKRSIPQLLVEKFASLYGKCEGLNAVETAEYQGLKKFWLKCCLNPNARSAEDLYEFLANHQFKIDNHGNFYAYRRVVSKNTENKQLVEFVSNAYTKVKAVWKKKPSDYSVFQKEDGEYGITQATGNIGNLETLYLELPTMQEKSYTSAHTGLEDYRIGEVIAMPRNEGNDNNQVSCSKGFHAASKAYDYSGFGDTPILVIINPMDVLAVPRNEVGKLRTSRWFFATVLDVSEQHILDDSQYDVSELGDTFEQKCMENITNHIHESFSQEVKRHTFTIPQISTTEISAIVNSLEKMSEVISKRVVNYEEEKCYYFEDEDQDGWND